MNTTSKQQYLTLALNTDTLRALVVGGGNIALRKVKTLARAGVDITVVAPKVNEQIYRYAQHIDLRAYAVTDVHGFSLVYAATDNKTVNLLITQDAKVLNIPVCNVSAPATGTFITPATIQRSNYIISVHTNARSPRKSKAILRRISRHWVNRYTRSARK